MSRGRRSPSKGTATGGGAMLLWISCAPPQKNSDTPYGGMRPVLLSTEIRWGPPCPLRYLKAEAQTVTAGECEPVPLVTTGYTKILRDAGSPGYSAALLLGWGAETIVPMGTSSGRRTAVCRKRRGGHHWSHSNPLLPLSTVAWPDGRPRVRWIR